jgi:hypothetical protein
MEKQKKQRGPEVALPPALRARIDRVREARRVGNELPLLTAVIRAAVEAGLPHLEGDMHTRVGA